MLCEGATLSRGIFRGNSLCCRTHYPLRSVASLHALRAHNADGVAIGKDIDAKGASRRACGSVRGGLRVDNGCEGERWHNLFRRRYGGRGDSDARLLETMGEAASRSAAAGGRRGAAEGAQHVRVEDQSAEGRTRDGARGGGLRLRPVLWRLRRCFACCGMCPGLVSSPSGARLAARQPFVQVLLVPSVAPNRIPFRSRYGCTEALSPQCRLTHPFTLGFLLMHLLPLFS
ncbi:hypothetical protein LSCM1_00153 [Leishmania martiniquensis]|uniref:Uncharacterized protein n=1 Tax=Leishmania martiniquensis TaxID=1580590 RepID=A0A836FK04_9TRYP|nr:hypothetical protein LSCM1_00153 [Leishmania martiniquensis]